MWQNLIRRPFPGSEDPSVHLCDYPEPDLAAIDEDLSRVMGVVRSLVGNRLAVRLPHTKLKKGFGVFLIFMGIFIIFRNLTSIAG